MDHTFEDHHRVTRGTKATKKKKSIDSVLMVGRRVYGVTKPGNYELRIEELETRVSKLDESLNTFMYSTHGE